MSLGDDYQAAIWRWTGNGGLDNAIAQAAAGHGGNLGDVRVLGLDTVGGARVQDFLVEQPVPEPGSMLLLGTGLIGLASRVRRRASR